MIDKLFLGLDNFLDFIWEYLPELSFLIGLFLAACIIAISISFSNAMLNR